MLEALGCDVVSVDAGADATLPAHPEPDEASLAELGDLVRRSGADVGFAQDADADRLVVVDEHGVPLGPDATVVLVVQRWLERGRGPVVVNVSTSRMVDDVAARFECPVYRSRVGEAHVIEAMKEHGAEVGGEGDGGAIVLPVNPCRDSFLAMALDPRVDGRLGAVGRRVAGASAPLLDGEGAPPLPGPGHRPFAPADQEPLRRGAGSTSPTA